MASWAEHHLGSTDFELPGQAGRDLLWSARTKRMRKMKSSLKLVAPDGTLLGYYRSGQRWGFYSTDGRRLG